MISLEIIIIIYLFKKYMFDAFYIPLSEKLAATVRYHDTKSLFPRKEIIFLGYELFILFQYFSNPIKL